MIGRAEAADAARLAGLARELWPGHSLPELEEEMGQLLIRACGLRCQGIGAALVHACVQWAAEQGCTEFASDCEWENKGNRRFPMERSASGRSVASSVLQKIFRQTARRPSVRRAPSACAAITVRVMPDGSEYGAHSRHRPVCNRGIRKKWGKSARSSGTRGGSSASSWPCCRASCRHP